MKQPTFDFLLGAIFTAILFVIAYLFGSRDPWPEWRWFLLLGGCVAALGTLLVLRSPRRHAKTFIRQISGHVSNHSGLYTAMFTLAVAIFTFMLWSSNEKLWTSSQENAQRQLRAYVEVSDLTITEPFTDKMAVEIRIKNTGLTPARNIRSVRQSAIVRKPVTWPVYSFADNPVTLELFDKDTKRRTQLLGAQQEHPLSVPSIFPFTPEEIRSWKSGESIYVAAGAIYYRDIYGIERFTKFCFEVDDPAEGNVGYCSGGNEEE